MTNRAAKEKMFRTAGADLYFMHRLIQQPWDEGVHNTTNKTPKSSTQQTGGREDTVLTRENMIKERRAELDWKYKIK